jgi:hypothetical protein
MVGKMGAGGAEISVSLVSIVSSPPNMTISTAAIKKIVTPIEMRNRSI